MPRSLRWFARAVMLGLAVFAVYYPYKFLVSSLPFAFSGDPSWQVHWMVDDTALVPFWARLAHFGLWIPTVVGTQIMIFLALYLVWLIHREVLFESRTVMALKWVGGSAVIAAFFALIAMALDAWWITSWNTELEKQPIHLRLESGEMGVLLCGLGLFLLGYVMDIAVLKKRENEGMI